MAAQANSDSPAAGTLGAPVLGATGATDFERHGPVILQRRGDEDDLLTVVPGQPFVQPGLAYAPTAVLAAQATFDDA